MAKTAAAPNAAPTAAEAEKPKSGKKAWIVVGAVCLLAVGGGAALPFFVPFGAHAAQAEPEHNAKEESKPTVIPFDSVVVNVADGRYTRYLRVKIVLVVESKDEKAVQTQLEKEKAFLQTWVIGYLQDKTMEQLHGSAGMHRIRREVRDEFNRRLFADGSDKIRDILLPEYNFQ